MKLEGICVVDLSAFLPGPYLTMALADHGARVIKIEPPEGDAGRGIGLSDGPSTVFFRNLNRGKESVTLDLKTPAGQAALLALCDKADVFVESFRPGVMKRLGLDYETLSASNPRIVYCSISAFGQTGPYRDRPAHDLAVESLCGVLGITLGKDDAPAMPGVPIADVVAALQGLSGVLMALLRREKTGFGDHIDVSMQEALLAATANVLGPVFSEGRQPIPKHERTTGGSAFYQIYETADGRHIVLGGQELKFVRNLLAHLEREDFIPLCERGPGPHQKPLIAYLQSVFGVRTLTELVEWFRPLDVCFAPVNTLPEAFEDEQIRARSLILTDGMGRRHIGPVIRFLREPADVSLVEPALGQHNARVLRQGQE
jgi:crotonobetainyl-CoA:carnitine CoA-transferase CaiB-like acyl-CoA transferase